MLLKVDNLWLQNLCTKQLSIVDGAGSVALPMAAPLWSMTAASGAAAPTTRALLTATTITVTPAEVHLMMYWSMLLSSSLPGLASYYRQGIMSALLGFMASNPQGSAPTITALTPSSITFDALSNSYVRGDDLTLTTSAPLQASQGGDFSTLPATDCDTGLAFAMTDPASLSPVWLVEASRDLLDSLQQAAQVTQVPAAGSYTPPMIIITSDTDVPDDLSSFGIELANDLILSGTPNSSNNLVSLDLHGQKAGVANTGTSRVLVQYLWLRNLATHVPGSLITQRSLASAGSAQQQPAARRQLQETTLSIALPLWFFDDHLSVVNASLVMDNVVLDLPVIEFGLLYAAAMRGSGWRAVISVNNAAATLLGDVQRYGASCCDSLSKHSVFAHCPSCGCPSCCAMW